MKIYIVKVITNACEFEIIEEFNKRLIEELQEYGVDYKIVTDNNYALVTHELDKEDLVIIYNNKNEEQYEDEWVKKFINKVNKYNIEIWPVAIDREYRKPADEAADKQSFDVWEQLRCRNLDENYVGSIAKIFSRKIISKAFPTLYCEEGEIFLSHRRVDGEEIVAKIYDKIIVMSKESTPFRDVVNVKVGENAQSIIDKHMERSDVFVFLHTPKSGESDWILKELRFALLRNMPILWVKIDDADDKLLKMRPSDKPHLSFNSNEFNDNQKLVKIVDSILNESFKLIMRRSNQILEYSEMINEMLNKKIKTYNEHKMIYHISAERKGYYYPQRNLEQYYQIFGRTPNECDKKCLNEELKNEEFDSIAILTNKLISCDKEGKVVMDSIDDFYWHWHDYLNESDINNEDREIVISGAFPDADEIYKQSLTDAIILFSKAILRNGYKLTFGAHPTFQNLFFEITKEERPKDYKQRLNMYISNWFLKNDTQKINQYKENCNLIITDEEKDLPQSLTKLRKEMIQRTKVKALVCLGGKSRSNNTEEGVREEIKLARDNGISVFVVGSVGGCSSKVASEYSNRGWKLINDAPEQLNEQFYKDIDYYNMAQKMVEFINKKD